MKRSAKICGIALEVGPVQNCDMFVILERLCFYPDFTYYSSLNRSSLFFNSILKVLPPPWYKYYFHCVLVCLLYVLVTPSAILFICNYFMLELVMAMFAYFIYTTRDMALEIASINFQHGDQKETQEPADTIYCTYHICLVLFGMFSIWRASYWWYICSSSSSSGALLPVLLWILMEKIPTQCLLWYHLCSLLVIFYIRTTFIICTTFTWENVLSKLYFCEDSFWK